MRIHHRVLYLSTKAGVDKKAMSQDWWAAWHFTIAVKSGRIKGYCYVPTGFFKRKIDDKNVAEARQIFGRWMSEIATKEIGSKRFALVPVPSKDAVVGREGPFRHMQMIDEAVRLLDPQPRVYDVLRFTQQLDKASQGGPRSRAELYPYLTVEGDLPTLPIILIDDVVTGGGHMAAAKQVLEDEDCDVRCGIVCGRTVWSLEGEPWKSAVFENVDICDFNF